MPIPLILGGLASGALALARNPAVQSGVAALIKGLLKQPRSATVPLATKAAQLRAAGRADYDNPYVRFPTAQQMASSYLKPKRKKRRRAY